MKRATYIQSYCSICRDTISLDSRMVFSTPSEDFGDFAKKAYSFLNISYPKFFKMDALGKLAFLAAETLLNKNGGYSEDNNIALVLSNKSSSLDTDQKHQHSIADPDNYFPSPALFVNTLPNICLAEISIRHNLQTESTFFIFDAFRPSVLMHYSNYLLETQKANKVLCGWTEYYNNEYRAFLYLVSGEGNAPHDEEILNTLYNK